MLIELRLSHKKEGKSVGNSRYIAQIPDLVMCTLLIVWQFFDKYLLVKEVFNLDQKIVKNIRTLELSGVSRKFALLGLNILFQFLLGLKGLFWKFYYRDFQILLGL